MDEYDFRERCRAAVEAVERELGGTATNHLENGRNVVFRIAGNLDGTHIRADIRLENLGHNLVSVWSEEQRHTSQTVRDTNRSRIARVGAPVQASHPDDALLCLALNAAVTYQTPEPRRMVRTRTVTLQEELFGDE